MGSAHWRFVYNILATLLFTSSFVVAWTVRLWLVFGPVVLLLLAIANWGLYQQRFVWWRIMVGWVYTGLVLGVAVAIGASTQWWQMLLSIPVLLVAAVALPPKIRDAIMDARLRFFGAPGWSDASPQTLDLLLKNGPLQIHEIQKITEHFAGAVLQERQTNLESYDVRWKTHTVYNNTKSTEAETWVLTRYRNFRKSKNLPLLPEHETERTVVHEESSIFQSAPQSLWDSPGALRRLEVLQHAPIDFQLHFINDATGRTHGPYNLLWDNDTPLAHEAFGDPREIQTHLIHELGTLSRVVLLERKRKIATQATLETAFEFVLQRFGAYRNASGLDANILPDISHEQRTLEQALRNYHVQVLLHDNTTTHAELRQGQWVDASQQKPLMGLVIRVVLMANLSNGHGNDESIASFDSLAQAQTFLIRYPNPEEGKLHAEES